ncbi:uncharacterized protein PpBr36_09538 [Pyricularia pennisetigena]|uniref:uncharacterized protein n=1 Tax=Pyricularia pennisetigena TaxID=1578925 RepID=UPI001152CB92|nr:uncharacterized protein PpBr36_09538 [Pyricularia pennisetigena]TLS22043.1 hypothetical protein PpBr36_09538 [Pyricularia pennisetigena]
MRLLTILINFTAVAYGVAISAGGEPSPALITRAGNSCADRGAQSKACCQKNARTINMQGQAESKLRFWGRNFRPVHPALDQACGTGLEIKLNPSPHTKNQRCARYLSHETTWNSDVHARILRRAAAPYNGITVVGATPAGIQLEWRSGTAADDASSLSKMVDYLLGKPLTIQILPWCTQFELTPECIETKDSQTLSNRGRLELGNWSASLLYRWSQFPSLCTDSCRKPDGHITPLMIKALPIVLVTAIFGRFMFSAIKETTTKCMAQSIEPPDSDRLIRVNGCVHLSLPVSWFKGLCH